LISFPTQIKEKLKYDFVYKGNVAQPGFYSLLVKVFRQGKESKQELNHSTKMIAI